MGQNLNLPGGLGGVGGVIGGQISNIQGLGADTGALQQTAGQLAGTGPGVASRGAIRAGRQALKEQLRTGAPVDVQALQAANVAQAQRQFSQMIDPSISEEFGALGLGSSSARQAERGRQSEALTADVQRQNLAIEAAAQEAARQRQLQAQGVLQGGQQLQQTGQIAGGGLQQGAAGLNLQGQVAQAGAGQNLINPLLAQQQQAQAAPPPGGGGGGNPGFGLARGFAPGPGTATGFGGGRTFQLGGRVPSHIMRGDFPSQLNVVPGGSGGSRVDQGDFLSNLLFGRTFDRVQPEKEKKVDKGQDLSKLLQLLQRQQQPQQRQAPSRTGFGGRRRDPGFDPLAFIKRLGAATRGPFGAVGGGIGSPTDFQRGALQLGGNLADFLQATAPLSQSGGATGPSSAGLRGFQFGGQPQFVGGRSTRTGRTPEQIQARQQQRGVGQFAQLGTPPVPGPQPLGAPPQQAFAGQGAPRQLPPALGAGAGPAALGPPPGAPQNEALGGEPALLGNVQSNPSLAAAVGMDPTSVDLGTSQVGFPGQGPSEGIFSGGSATFGPEPAQALGAPQSFAANPAIGAASFAAPPAPGGSHQAGGGPNFQTMDTSVGDLGVGFQEGGQALGGDMVGPPAPSPIAGANFGPMPEFVAPTFNPNSQSRLNVGMGMGIPAEQLLSAGGGGSAINQFLGANAALPSELRTNPLTMDTGNILDAASEARGLSQLLEAMRGVGRAKGSSADLGGNVGAQAIADFLSRDIGNQQRQRIQGFQFGGKAEKGITSEDAFRRFLQEGGEPGAFRPVLSLANLGLKESDIEEVVRENLRGKATISLLQQMGIVPLQHGGTVPGPATPADSVPALLTGGELIVPTDIVNELEQSTPETDTLLGKIKALLQRSGEVVTFESGPQETQGLQTFVRGQEGGEVPGFLERLAHAFSFAPEAEFQTRPEGEGENALLDLLSLIVGAPTAAEGLPEPAGGQPTIEDLEVLDPLGAAPPPSPVELMQAAQPAPGGPLSVDGQEFIPGGGDQFTLAEGDVTRFTPGGAQAGAGTFSSFGVPTLESQMAEAGASPQEIEMARQRQIAQSSLNRFESFALKNQGAAEKLGPEIEAKRAQVAAIDQQLALMGAVRGQQAVAETEARGRTTAAETEALGRVAAAQASTPIEDLQIRLTKAVEQGSPGAREALDALNGLSTGQQAGLEFLLTQEDPNLVQLALQASGIDLPGELARDFFGGELRIQETEELSQDEAVTALIEALVASGQLSQGQ